MDKKLQSAIAKLGAKTKEKGQLTQTLARCPGNGEPITGMNQLGGPIIGRDCIHMLDLDKLT
jgi:hypothetical protein